MRYLESTARLKRVGKALRPAADMQDFTILFVFFSDVGVCSRVCYSKNELLTSTSQNKTGLPCWAGRFSGHNRLGLGQLRFGHRDHSFDHLAADRAALLAVHAA